MSSEAIAEAGSIVSDIVPAGKNAQNAPSVLYNAMIAPWSQFSIRAVIWYQGKTLESI